MAASFKHDSGCPDFAGTTLRRQSRNDGAKFNSQLLRLFALDHLLQDALVANRPDVDRQDHRIDRSYAVSMMRCCASITGASCSSNANRRMVEIFSWICAFSFSSGVFTLKRTAVKK